MKFHTRLQLTILLLAGLTLGAIDAHASGVVTLMTVQDGTLIYCNPNSGCPNAYHGNINVAKNEKPDLSWVLTGAAGWEFTKLEFNTQPNGSGDWEEPGDSALPACTNSAMPGPYTINGGGRHLKIKDHNQTGCVTAYRVCAEPSSGAEQCAHPVITNEGTDATQLPGTKLDYIIEILEAEFGTAQAE